MQEQQSTANQVSDVYHISDYLRSCQCSQGAIRKLADQLPGGFHVLALRGCTANGHAQGEASTQLGAHQKCLSCLIDGLKQCLVNSIALVLHIELYQIGPQCLCRCMQVCERRLSCHDKCLERAPAMLHKCNAFMLGLCLLTRTCSHMYERTPPGPLMAGEGGPHLSPSLSHTHT